MKKSPRLMLPALLCVLMTLPTCAPTLTTATTACRAFCPISYSASKDTPQTVQEVRSHNAAWGAICPNEAPAHCGKTLPDLESAD